MQTKSSFVQKCRIFAAAVVVASAWVIVYTGIEPFSMWFSFSALGLEAASRSGQAVQFFVYDTVKILLLLVMMVYVIALIRAGLNVAQAEQYVGRRLEALQATPPAGRRTFILKDVRLFLNSLDRGLRLVREAGIGAESRREDTEDAILLTIRIPKAVRRG